MYDDDLSTSLAFMNRRDVWMRRTIGPLIVLGLLHLAISFSPWTPLVWAALCIQFALAVLQIILIKQIDAPWLSVLRHAFGRRLSLPIPLTPILPLLVVPLIAPLLGLLMPPASIALVVPALVPVLFTLSALHINARTLFARHAELARSCSRPLQMIA